MARGRSQRGGDMVEHSARARVAVIIEDDPDVRSLLDEVFLAAGFATVLRSDGPSGLAAITRHEPAITTLDVNLPGIDGLEVARRIRTMSSTHIIMISALGDESDVVLGLTSGADDYLVKPFRPRELRARIEAFMRRPHSAATAEVQAARQSSTPQTTASSRRSMRHLDLIVDPDTHTVQAGTGEVVLTPTEFVLLSALLESQRRVQSKADLARLVRTASGAASDYIAASDKRAVEVHMTNLRRKIGDTPTSPRYIETVRGVGYRLTTGEESG